jgi:hypothetical protein
MRGLLNVKQQDFITQIHCKGLNMRAIVVVLGCLLLWSVAEAAYQEEAYPAAHKGEHMLSDG